MTTPSIISLSPIDPSTTIVPSVVSTNLIEQSEKLKLYQIFKLLYRPYVANDIKIIHYYATKLK